jgi:energy-coupling factor transporter ATP-binding protein EcfA2
MKGKYNIVISDAHLRFDFWVERQITIIKGNSGTGKSTFYNAVAELLKNKDRNGFHCNCKDKLEVLNYASWKDQLDESKGKIIVCEETDDIVNTKEFASAVNGSDNYFIIISRTGRMKLEYSSENVYEFKTDYGDGIPTIKMYIRGIHA